MARQPGLRPVTNARTLRLLAIERILEEAGVPLHFTQIHQDIALLLPPHAAMSERNVHAWLSRYTDSFVWTGKGMYGLKKWDMGRRIDDSAAGLPDELHTRRRRGIGEEIALILLEEGGGVSLSELEERVLARFTVSKEAIRAAVEQDRAGRFKLRRGVVYLA